MDRLNLLHKFLLITVVALFAVNQAALSRIEQELHDGLPELRIKKEVATQGTGKEARVIVTLRDDRTVEGYIDEITDTNFTLVDRSSGKSLELAFRIVKDIRPAGSGWALVGTGLETAAHAIELLARKDTGDPDNYLVRSY